MSSAFTFIERIFPPLNCRPSWKRAYRDHVTAFRYEPADQMHASASLLRSVRSVSRGNCVAAHSVLIPPASIAATGVVAVHSDLIFPFVKWRTSCNILHFPLQSSLILVGSTVYKYYTVQIPRGTSENGFTGLQRRMAVRDLNTTPSRSGGPLGTKIQSHTINFKVLNFVKLQYFTLLEIEHK